MKASAQPRPAQRSANRQEVATTKYTAHSPRAVSAMRGVSFSSFIGPGVSALSTWLPPTPSNGKIATTNTKMPMPPNSTMKQRQTLIEVGKVSKPVNTVAPVVVRPDMASK